MFLSISSLLYAEGSSFSSFYTDFSKDCRTVSSGTHKTAWLCSGPSPYNVWIDVAPSRADIRVIKETPYMPAHAPATAYLTSQRLDALERTLEWRLWKGQPFAVILRVDEYMPEIAESGVGFSRKIETGKQQFLVRGLDDWNPIAFTVPANRQATEEIHELVDEQITNRVSVMAQNN